MNKSLGGSAAAGHGHTEPQEAPLERCTLRIKSCLFHSFAFPFLIKKSKHLPPLCPTILLLGNLMFPFGAIGPPGSCWEHHPVSLHLHLEKTEEKIWYPKRMRVQR